MSRIAIFFAIGDGTRDRGEKSRGLVLKNKTVKVTKFFSTEKKIKVANIISADAWREEAARHNAGEKAIAGGLLFGVTGAVIGAATADNYKWYGEIVTAAEKITFRFNNATDVNTFTKWWEKVQKKRK